MIALAASLIIIFYVLVPGGIFRFATSLAVPLKKFHKTKTEEITFSIIASLLPFGLAMALVWSVATWPLSTERHMPRKEAYRLVFTSLSSDRQLDDSLKSGSFWPAFNSVLRRQVRFLWWYYLLVALEALLFWWLVSRYGNLRGNRLYDFLAQHLLIPSISEWHVILTDFAVPKGSPREIEIDVLSTDDILYQGKISDYFLNAEGELSGILLSEAFRFDRDLYAAHKKADFENQVRRWPNPPVHQFASFRSTYWKRIPGADLFYIPREHISNLNVRHATSAVSQAAQERLKERGITFFISEAET